MLWPIKQACFWYISAVKQRILLFHCAAAAFQSCEKTDLRDDKPLSDTSSFSNPELLPIASEPKSTKGYTQIKIN